MAQKTQLFALCGGIVLILATLTLATIDYFSWWFSNPLLGNTTGNLLTVSFLYHLILIPWVMDPLFRSFKRPSVFGQVFNYMTDFFLFIALATVVCGFMLATGAIWGIFVWAGFFLLALGLDMFLIGLIWRGDIREMKIFYLIPGWAAFVDSWEQREPLSLLWGRRTRFFWRTIPRIFTVILVLILYIAGGITAHAQITGGDPVLGQVTGAGAGIAAGYTILALCTLTVISLKGIHAKAHPKAAAAIGLIGIVFIGAYSLPFIHYGSIIRDTDQQFAAIFGPEWNTFPAEVQANFLPAPMVVSQFYFGYGYDRLGDPANIRYRMEADILYANYSGYQLYYDIYYPAPERAGPTSLGKNTSILMFHSGGWNGGNKGEAKQIQVYLASHGFVTFDVQYRLLNSSLMNTTGEFGFNPGWSVPPTAPNLYGNYTIRDMVIDVGEFIRHFANLTENARHGGRLDSVIISGVSAGGYLAACAAYGYHHPWFAGNFSDALNVRAVMLYNPPNDANFFFYEGHPMYYPLLIPGTPEQLPDWYYHLTPSNLVNASSPPTILFHGTIDKMVPPENSQQLYEALRNAGRDAILVKGPYGGHGFDFGPLFAPITMYYLERFLYHVLN
jgi:acetyl esterase/lipase